jgi:hypothetical protein
VSALRELATGEAAADLTPERISPLELALHVSSQTTFSVPAHRSISSTYLPGVGSMASRAIPRVLVNKSRRNVALIVPKQGFASSMIASSAEPVKAHNNGHNDKGPTTHFGFQTITESQKEERG